MLIVVTRAHNDKSFAHSVSNIPFSCVVLCLGAEAPDLDGRDAGGVHALLRRLRDATGRRTNVLIY